MSIHDLHQFSKIVTAGLGSVWDTVKKDTEDAAYKILYLYLILGTFSGIFIKRKVSQVSEDTVQKITALLCIWYRTFQKYLPQPWNWFMIYASDLSQISIGWVSRMAILLQMHRRPPPPSSFPASPTAAPSPRPARPAPRGTAESVFQITTGTTFAMLFLISK